jgi:cyclophilin family peptidyl-prolyl cis-trans isomerase
MLLSTTALAQNPAPPAGGGPPSSNKPAEVDEPVKFTNLDISTQELRTHLKKMRQLAIKYHLSDDNRQTKEMSAEWRRLLASGHNIHDGMIQAAVRDFRESPEITGPAGQFLMMVTGRNADADRFDNMYDILELLKRHGGEGQPFDLCFGLTAAASNNYAAARPHLDIAASNLESGAKEFMKAQKLSEDERKLIAQKLTQTYELVKDLSQTEKYEKLWQEELKAREADAAGEPLPRVLIETTKGEIVVELFENNAPNTVANFIELCEKNFYNGLPFHRVLSHFMAQGGDPNRDGTGGPGYAIATELNGKTDRGFFRGTLGMAISGLPNSGGSQFFICYVPRSNLNGKYVAFGRVVEGMNIVSDLARIDPDSKENEQSRQDTPDEIVSTKVLRKRAHEYKAEKLPEPKPDAHDHAH